MSDEPKILERLQRIEDLLSALVKKQLGDVISSELQDAKMRKLYALTGQRTSRQLSKETGLGIATISRAWQRWEGLGLVVKDAGVYRKVV